MDYVTIYNTFDTELSQISIFTGHRKAKYQSTPISGYIMYYIVSYRTHRSGIILLLLLTTIGPSEQR